MNESRKPEAKLVIERWEKGRGIVVGGGDGKRDRKQRDRVYSWWGRRTTQHFPMANPLKTVTVSAARSTVFLSAGQCSVSALHTYSARNRGALWKFNRGAAAAEEEELSWVSAGEKRGRQQHVLQYVSVPPSAPHQNIESCRGCPHTEHDTGVTEELHCRVTFSTARHVAG